MPAPDAHGSIRSKVKAHAARKGNNTLSATALGKLRFTIKSHSACERQDELPMKEATPDSDASAICRDTPTAWVGAPSRTSAAAFYQAPCRDSPGHWLQRPATFNDTAIPRRRIAAIRGIPNSMQPATLVEPKKEITLAEKYLEWLTALVRRQRSAEEAVERMLQVLLQTGSDLTSPIALRRFGSRLYDFPVPSSDLDLVLQLPEDSRRDHALEDIYKLLRNDNRCTSVNSAIKYKHTIEFRFAGLWVDLTACCGTAQMVHVPTQTSEFVKFAFMSLPPEVSQVAHLVVACAKRAHVCHSRKGAAIGKQMKGVHLILLVVVWSRSHAYCANTASSLEELVCNFFVHFLRFPFERNVIDARKLEPFSERTEDSKVPMWLIDPIRPDHNLLERITDESLSMMRSRIHGLLDELCNRPLSFWSAGKDQWAVYHDRDYNTDVPRSSMASLEYTVQGGQVSALAKTLALENGRAQKNSKLQIVEHPCKRMEDKTGSASSIVNDEALFAECAPERSTPEVLEAANNKKTWRDHMMGPAKQLDLRLNADYKRTKTWPPMCMVCSKGMVRGAANHLPGKAHFKQLRQKLQKAGSDDNKWDQQFTLLSNTFVFNHLTGHLRLGDGGIKVEHKAEDKAKTASVLVKRIAEDSEGRGLEEPPKKKLILEQRPKKYLDAVTDAKQWLLWMEYRAYQLHAEILTASEAAHEPLLLSREAASKHPGVDLMATGSAQRNPAGQGSHRDERRRRDRQQHVMFVCAFCPEKGVQDAVEHLLSEEHRSKLESILKHRGWPSGPSTRGCLSRWTQHFRWPSGNYFFNHVTGEQCWDTSKMDTCCPWGSLKVCFLDAFALPDGNPYGYVLADDETWERDVKEGGRCLRYGWTESQSTCILKPRGKKSGHERWHNNLAWKISVPQGTYTVRLGMLFQLEPTQHALPRVAGHVNQEHIELYVRDCKKHHEHIVTTNVIDHIIISGTLPIYYVHIQAGEYLQLSARQPREAVPSFNDKSARGVPKDWNRPDNVPKESDESALFWGGRAKKFFSGALTRLNQKPIIVNLQLASSVISEFLVSRPGSEGDDLLDKLGPPLLQDDGWFCFTWRPYLDMARVSENSSEYKWERAWHGCKFEALYSIMYHGQLLPSRDKSLGERFFGGLPGVYVHKDKTAQKANNYVRFVQLRNDGVFWAAKWEVRVNRKKGIPLDANKSTDQWIQPADSVLLAALWLCGRTAAELHEGDPVAREWNPDLEAHPRRLHDARMTHLQDPLI